MSFRIRQQQFRGPASGPHLLITGGVHGDEFEPIAAIRRLAGMLATSNSVSQTPDDPASAPPSDNVTLLRGTVTLVPCVNEEAFLLGSRCAADKLDLARTCPGRPDGSVTEQVAYDLSQLIRTADFYIDLHTGGTEFSILPLSGYVLHSDPAVLEHQRRMARAFQLPLIWGTSPELEGRSLSVARDANVPAIYCEHGGAASCSPAGVVAYVNGCLNVLGLLEMIDRPSVDLSVPQLVEEPQPDSGHLQICNPSPVDGFFEPAVSLGDKIDADAPIGSVIDLCNDETHVVRSQHSGIVLMLRTFPRVRAGDSVGVVLAEESNERSDLQVSDKGEPQV